ncbi:MAG: hypothetical protein ACI4TP_06655 [Anaerotignum sp.]
MAEMTALEYFKTKNRMVEATKRGNCMIECNECPLSGNNNGKKMTCSFFEIAFPERAISEVQRWAEEHPVKTMMQDFLEKYPNAPTEYDGTPEFCPGSLGYQNNYELCESSDDNKCMKCWNRPLEG